MSEIVVRQKVKIPTETSVATSRYAVIDVKSLTKLVNDHLTTCITCGGEDIVFSIEENNGLSNVCKVFCPSCELDQKTTCRSKRKLKLLLDNGKLPPPVRKHTLREIRKLDKKIEVKHGPSMYHSVTHPHKVPLFSSVQIDLQRERLENGTLKGYHKSSIVSHTINLQIFLSTFANGGGIKEAMCTLGHLDVPNLEGLRNSYNRRLEDICRSIKKTTSEVIYQAFLGEVEAVILEQLSIDEKSELDLKKYMTRWYGLEGPEKDKDKAGLTIAFDMGWNKRGCGHRYDSLSGHAIIIGTKTQKVIWSVCYSTHCINVK